MKKLTPKQYAKILFDLTAGLESATDIKKAVAAFMRLLARQHVLRQGGAIVTAFADYADRRAGRQPVSVISVQRLDASAKKRINTYLAGAVIREETLDPDLIGGIVVCAKDILFDGSIRGQLQRLHGQLITNN